MTPSRFGLVEGRMIIARNPRATEPASLPEERTAPIADAPRPRMTTPRTAAPPTAPIVVVALAGILVAVSSLLGFYGDDSVFGAFSVITGATVVFAMAGTLGCGLAATALAVLSRDPRAAVAVPLLGAAALGATIGGLDFNYVDYFDVTSLNDLEGHDMPTGLELAIVAAPVLWGAGLWLLLGRTKEIAARVRRWDVVAAGAGVLLAGALVGLQLVLQAAGDALVLGWLLMPVVAGAPVVALALRPPRAWHSAIVMSLGAAGAAYGLVALAPYGIVDLIAIAAAAVIAVYGVLSFRDRTR